MAMNSQKYLIIVVMDGILRVMETSAINLLILPIWTIKSVPDIKIKTESIPLSMVLLLAMKVKK